MSTLQPLIASVIVSPWIVTPLAVLTLVALALHLSLLRADIEMPPSRRRIRTVNGVVMMSTVPVFAYAVGGVSYIDDPRNFALAWLFTLGLVGIMSIMAILDAGNTARLHGAERRELRSRLREEREAAILEARAAQEREAQ